MGMQSFIKHQVYIREKFVKDDKIIKCSSCGRGEKSFFRNLLNTLECMCGAKFYNI